MSKTAYFHFGDLLAADDVSGPFLVAVMNCSELEQVVEVESYHKGRPAKLYLKNGDPGYPEEEAEMELSETVDSLTDKALKSVQADLPTKYSWPPNAIGVANLFELRRVISAHAHTEISRIEAEYFAELSQEEPDEDAAIDRYRDRQERDNCEGF
jgi:hypothetical protein